jgi:hypothetical protein
MKAHDLAQVLLNGDNVPVVLQTLTNVNQAALIQKIDLYQNIDSPFEYCLLLSSEGSVLPNDELEVPD